MTNMTNMTNLTNDQRGETILNLIEAGEIDIRFIANRLVARRPARAALLADFLNTYIQIFDVKNSQEVA